jgi:flavin reductase (DIM6/NTAB) family NADH-FMN oxidoreductase RutF
MTIDAEGFRAVLGRLASGVCLVTMRVAEEDHGFTATSVTSLSLSPMLVLICVAHGQRSHDLLTQAGHFGICLLDHTQTELGVRFATGLLDQRFQNLSVQRAETGAPLLADCLGWLDCRIDQVLSAGDHSIVIGEVLAGSARHEGMPLIYFKRQWGTFQGDE